MKPENKEHIDNKPIILDEMIKLITALEEHPQWRDKKFCFGVYTKVTCKPVFYVQQKVYNLLYLNFFLKPIIDENHFSLGGYGDPATFMGVEVRVIKDSPKIADYALAFEPV